MTDASETPLTPDALARFIARQHIDAQIEHVAMDTPTVLDAAMALGVQTAQIIKTLLFLIKEEPVLMIACGDATVDRRPLAERFGVGKKQVKLADAQTVLRITGYPVGGVPPFGHITVARVLLDEKMRLWDVVYGGGGDHRTLLRVTPTELARVTGGEWLLL